MHPALLYLPGDRLALPELSAARIDGHLVELGDGYIPADLVESAAARAAALGALIRPGMAASGPSAAWIHGAGDAAPWPHHAHRATSRRVRVPATPRLVFHDTAIDSADLQHVGDVTVTSPLRTMTDLALGLYRDASFRRWLDALAVLHPPLAAGSRDALLARRRVPGMRLALRELDRLAGGGPQDDVTR